MKGILTRKQSWRRQLYCEKKSEKDLINYDLALLNGNFRINDYGTFHPPKRKVRFCSSAMIILIPTVEEFRKAGLSNLIWWSNEEFQDIKKCAMNELKVYMVIFNIMDSRKALKSLYQVPSDIESRILEKSFCSNENYFKNDSKVNCPLDSNDINNSNEFTIPLVPIISGANA